MMVVVECPCCRGVGVLVLFREEAPRCSCGGVIEPRWVLASAQ